MFGNGLSCMPGNDLRPAQVVSTMLRKMPQRMAGSMPEVVKAVVAKLASAESSPLITSLLVVLAQLMHVNTSQFLDFLASQPAPGTCSTWDMHGGHEWPMLKAERVATSILQHAGRSNELGCERAQDYTSLHFTLEGDMMLRASVSQKGFPRHC